MAPEIANGNSGLSPVADVFAAGILLAELLSGKPPFSHLANQLPLTLMFAIANGQRPALSQGTPKLRALISRAWAGDAVARPEAAVLHLELRSMAADGVGGGAAAACCAGTGAGADGADGAGGARPGCFCTGGCGGGSGNSSSSSSHRRARARGARRREGRPVQELLAANELSFLHLKGLDPAVLAGGLRHLLAVNASRSTLWLAVNKIGDVGVVGLGKALEVNASLKELRLWGNQIGNSGALGLAKALDVNVADRALPQPQPDRRLGRSR
ncbi:hypothetical protein T492DRAFT_1107378, partial [Pavlovales sp. CCMP2436]